MVKEHTVTLHKMSLEILAHQRAISSGGPLGFEAIREHEAGQGHIDGNALRWVINKVVVYCYGNKVSHSPSMIYGVALQAVVQSIWMQKV